MRIRPHMVTRGHLLELQNFCTRGIKDRPKVEFQFRPKPKVTPKGGWLKPKVTPKGGWLKPKVTPKGGWLKPKLPRK